MKTYGTALHSRCSSWWSNFSGNLKGVHRWEWKWRPSLYHVRRKNLSASRTVSQKRHQTWTLIFFLSSIKAFSGGGFAIPEQCSRATKQPPKWRGLTLSRQQQQSNFSANWVTNVMLRNEISELSDTHSQMWWIKLDKVLSSYRNTSPWIWKFWAFAFGSYAHKRWQTVL